MVKSRTETHLGQTYCMTSKLVWEVRCTEYCSCVSIFARILKLLAQIASMFSLNYFCSQYFKQLLSQLGEWGGSCTLAKYCWSAVTRQRGEPGIQGKRISNCCSWNGIVLVCVIHNRAHCEAKVPLEGVKWQACGSAMSDNLWGTKLDIRKNKKEATKNKAHIQTCKWLLKSNWLNNFKRISIVSVLSELHNRP